MIYKLDKDSEKFLRKALKGVELSLQSIDRLLEESSDHAQKMRAHIKDAKAMKRSEQKRKRVLEKMLRTKKVDVELLKP